MSAKPKNDEWYTPPEVMDKVRYVLGRIQLDPCSCEEANRYVDAMHYISLPHDGLAVNWMEYANLYLNPPYSRPGPWVEKAIRTYRPAVVVVNNSTETVWGQRLLRNAEAMFFPRGRISFVAPGGERGGGNRYAQMIALLYPNSHILRRFREVFDEGTTLRR